jgi:hypothetical protein
MKLGSALFRQPINEAALFFVELVVLALEILIDVVGC